MDIRNTRSTGVVRKCDTLGRLVLPVEIRRVMGITDNDALEVLVADVDGKPAIIVRRYQPGCVFCTSMTDIAEYGGYQVCAKCRAGIAAVPSGSANSAGSADLAKE